MEAEKNLIYKTNEYKYNFKNFQTIKTFGWDIHEDKITTEEADEYQKGLLLKILSFKKHTKPRILEKKNKKNKLFLKTCIVFLRGEKEFLMLLKAKYFR